MGSSPTASVRPGAHRTFLKKAREFGHGMERAVSEGDLNMAASAACHCVISACDAILAQRLGLRSRAADHATVADMVANLGIEGAGEYGALAERVLSLKSRAEYEDREVSRADAERAVQQARRFLRWVDARISGK